jgi:hypothetical protein
VPDWEQMLRERLSGLRLEPPLHDDIVAELAGHLEDAYHSLLAQGMEENEAQKQAWAELSNARLLVRNIRRAKQGDEKMKNQIKQIWVPGLATTALSTILLSSIHHAGLRPFTQWSFSHASLYLPWLLLMPFFGFIGAYWARRAGARIPATIVSGVFPSLFYFAFPYLILPFALVADPSLTPAMSDVGWLLFVSPWYLLNWVALPFVALLAGALPVAVVSSQVTGQVPSRSVS